MKTCEKCGFINDDGARFCTSCGSLLPDTPEDIAEIVDEIAEDTVDEVAEEPVAAPEPIPVPAPVPAPVYTAPAPVQTEPVNVPKKGEHTVKGRAFGIIGFIINLDALIASLLPGSNFGALIYSIIGLIFCHVSKNNTNFRLTKVAKVFGILALIFSIVTIVIYGVLMYLFIELLANDPQVQDFFGRLFY